MTIQYKKSNQKHRYNLTSNITGGDINKKTYLVILHLFTFQMPILFTQM